MPAAAEVVPQAMSAIRTPRSSSSTFGIVRSFTSPWPSAPNSPRYTMRPKLEYMVVREYAEQAACKLFPAITVGSRA